MIVVELVYDADCPNVKDTRSSLLRAFAATGLRPQWREWDRNAPESPAHVRGCGSPTILVNGQDMDGDSPPPDRSNCCRVYADESGQRTGVPPVQAIASALLMAKDDPVAGNQSAAAQRTGWRRAMAAFPAISTALLPKLTCPACWPAYTGLLSFLGLGFANYTPYLMPLTVLFFILAVGSLGYRAKQRRGFRPLLLGILAGTLVTVGKFVLDSDWTLYGGAGLLMVASLWNSWPQPRTAGSACSTCSHESPAASLLAGNGSVNT